jgi:hypothetical protein
MYSYVTCEPGRNGSVAAGHGRSHVELRGTGHSFHTACFVAPVLDALTTLRLTLPLSLSHLYTKCICKIILHADHGPVCAQCGGPLPDPKGCKTRDGPAHCTLRDRSVIGRDRPLSTLHYLCKSVKLTGGGQHLAVRADNCSRWMIVGEIF